MTRNQALLEELIQYIDEIKISINKINRMNENHLENKLENNFENNLENLLSYESELKELQENVQHALKISRKSLFFEKNAVVKSLMKMIDKLNEEMTQVEVGVHGVVNYSLYESKNKNEDELDVFSVKKKIKNDLSVMLKLVIQARPEIRNAELSGMIKMLR